MPLSSPSTPRIVRLMLKRLLPITLSLAGAVLARAETVQLRDRAAVTGAILAEKRDQIVIDLGYTVLAIPRSYIVRVTKEEATPAKTSSARPSDKSSVPAVPPATKV